jgi:hypothetical protein
VTGLSSEASRRARSQQLLALGLSLGVVLVSTGARHRPVPSC